MKSVIITDTHMGVRCGNSTIRDHQFDFYENQLFPFMKANDIFHIFHTGDFFDTRSALSHRTISDAKRFTSLLESNEFAMTILVGNHDIPNKSDNEFDATSLILGDCPNVTVISKNEVLDDIAFVPWVNKNNYEEFLEFIQKTKAKYLFGHFDFLGAKFNKYDQPSLHGIDPNLVKKFDKVLSGHFHTKSTLGNIEYLGAPFEYTWADWNDPKGFHVFDEETGELTFIENKKKLFYKTFIAEDGSTKTIPEIHVGESLDNKFVMVESVCTDKKIVKKVCESIGKVEDLQVVVKPVETIVEEISVSSIDNMIVDGVQSVIESRRQGVLNILQQAMEKVK